MNLTPAAPTPKGPTPETIARAFSGHAFHEAYPYLAEDVRWILIGGPTLVGKEAAIEACEGTLQELAHTETTFTKFRTVVGADAVVVDVVGEYSAPDQAKSVVASCDIFDFSDGLIHTITSYTTELSDENQPSNL